MTGEIGKMAAEVTKSELGIRSDTRQLKDRLTPVSQPPDDLFERGGVFSLFGRKEEKTKPLDPELAQTAKQAVELYDQFHSMRDSKGKKSETRKIVGKVSVSPAGPEGKYIVSFTTTNFAGEDDWQAWAASMMFDQEPTNLDHIDPARETNWLVAQKGEHRLVIRYEKFHQRTGGKVAETLEKEGWENVREIWTMDIDRWAGTLTPSAEQTE